LPFTSNASPTHQNNFKTKLVGQPNLILSIHSSHNIPTNYIDDGYIRTITNLTPSATIFIFYFFMS